MSTVFILALLLSVSLASKLLDSTLGLGYGTLLVPVLVILGFHIVRVIPAVLFSEFASSGLTAVLHRAVGNISGRVESCDFKVSALLSFLGVLGAIAGVLIGVSLSEYLVTVFVSIVVIFTGMLVLQRFRWTFSWGRVSAFGLIASFNKALSGGGYGTIIAGGQILSGRDGARALGTTSVAEAVTTGVSWLLYFLLGHALLSLHELLTLDLHIVLPLLMQLELPLVLGALLSAPLSVLLIKKLDSESISPAIGAVSVCLGIVILLGTAPVFGWPAVLTTVVLVLIALVVSVIRRIQR